MNPQLAEFCAQIKQTGAKTRICTDNAGTTINVHINSILKQQEWGRKSVPFFFPLSCVDPEFYTKQSKSQQPSQMGTAFDVQKRDVLKAIQFYQTIIPEK